METSPRKYIVEKLKAIGSHRVLDLGEDLFIDYLAEQIGSEGEITADDFYLAFHLALYDIAERISPVSIPAKSRIYGILEKTGLIRHFLKPKGPGKQSPEDALYRAIQESYSYLDSYHVAGISAKIGAYGLEVAPNEDWLRDFTEARKEAGKTVNVDYVLQRWRELNRV